MPPETPEPESKPEKIKFKRYPKSKLKKAEEKPVLYIIAGDHIEARIYSEMVSQYYICVFVDVPDTLRGLRNFKFCRVGKWINRKDLRELDEIIEAQNGIEVAVAV